MIIKHVILQPLGLEMWEEITPQLLYVVMLEIVMVRRAHVTIVEVIGVHLLEKMPANIYHVIQMKMANLVAIMVHV